MEISVLIYLRAELNANEFRCPLIPSDIKILIENGFKVFIESSKYRIYEDEKYEKIGAIVTLKPWHDNEFKNALIIGLKEISDLNKLDNHKHIFFSHSFKNQTNSEIILKSFAESNSIIYDYEYLLDTNNKRIIAFGFYAGFIGCNLGLMQYYNKKKFRNNINNLHPFTSKKDLLGIIEKTESIKCVDINNLKIAVIGPNGRCGKGVINVLDYFNLQYDKFTKEDAKNKLESYDIIFNCIVLNKDLNETWFDEKTIFNKPLIIVDISCDYNNPHNPIKIYNQATTWSEPVYSYNKFVDIISINNLPSLLPKDSSDEFSEILVKLLLNFNTDSIWENNKNYFLKIID